MSEFYILDGKVPVRASLKEWVRWFETAERHVADLRDGDIRVSTVFLGLDHAILGESPLLFETMVFGGPLDGELDRGLYTTYGIAKLLAWFPGPVLQATSLQENGSRSSSGLELS